ncbi:MAG: lytic murein transglycosylase [Proteobacteria bacterium]|nr:lytic murein transglycosylase [Pseudomonadota bacterium]
MASRKIEYRQLGAKDRLYLVSLFENSNFEKRFLNEIFFDQRLKKIPIVINKNVVNKENARNYNDFLSPYSILLATRFSKKWRTTLQRASRKFQVDTEILVAILLVETGLGNVMGNYPVISVFSSLILENHHLENRKFGEKRSGSKDEEYMRKRLRQKSNWATTELAALLRIIEQTKHNPFHFKGSFAGAFGLPQFLPSSYLKWGYDSDKNGTVNLFLFPDAIFSAANYLKAHGWKKGLYQKSNKNVIWNYNHSRIYVDTVFKIARKIRTNSRPKTKPGTQKNRSQVAVEDDKNALPNPS